MIRHVQHDTHPQLSFMYHKRQMLKKITLVLFNCLACEIYHFFSVPMTVISFLSGSTTLIISRQSISTLSLSRPGSPLSAPHPPAWNRHHVFAWRASTHNRVDSKYGSARTRSKPSRGGRANMSRSFPGLAGRKWTGVLGSMGVRTQTVR